MGKWKPVTFTLRTGELIAVDGPAKVLPRRYRRSGDGSCRSDGRCRQTVFKPPGTRAVVVRLVEVSASGGLDNQDA